MEERIIVREDPPKVEVEKDHDRKPASKKDHDKKPDPAAEAKLDPKN